MSTAIPVSTIPVALTKIVSAIQALLTADGQTNVLVTISTPDINEPRDIILVNSEVRQTVEPFCFVGDGGPNSLYEKYDIDVQVSVAWQTQDNVTDPMNAFQRAAALVGYVTTAVRQDPSLGTSVIEAYPAAGTGWRVAWGAGTTPGRVVEITVPIHVEAAL